MSNFLAIATVTATLQTLLQAAVSEDVSGATVTVVRPDGSNNGLPNPGANIYLYQVTPNAAWRNEDLPTRSGEGRLVRKPQVALDLHYLFTFHGNDKELEPQRVLGSVARTLHSQSVLGRDVIESTVGSVAYLANSDLARDVELVKLMPLSLSLEELSKLWSVFFQTPYTLSMAYLATTVLIEGAQAPQRPLPVRVRNIAVFPFQSARIDKVVSPAGDVEPIVMSTTALIRGEGLGGSVQAVRVGEADLGPTAAGHTEISVQLTDSNLRAGVQAVQIIYRDGSASNVAPLILRPAIIRDEADHYEITVSGVVINPEDGTRSATVTVRLAPQLGPRQRVFLLLNEAPPSGEPARAFIFPAEPRTADTDLASFQIRGVGVGEYLIRVQVAGAETLLETDGTGTYSAPSITV